MSDTVVKETSKRDRSPKYPYISLPKAIQRIEILYKKAKRYDARVADIAKDWDLSPKSSSTDRNIAAIQSFGLIEDSGSGDNRKIKLTELGARILIDERPGVREDLIAQSAMKPPIIAEYANKWAEGRPEDPHALGALQFEGGFTEEAAKIFLRVYDETLRLVGAGRVDSKADNLPDKDDDTAKLVVEPNVGDIVQIEVDGAFVLPAPSRLRAIETHDGKKWAFVAGSETGVPIEQVVVQSKASIIPLSVQVPTMPEQATPSVTLLSKEEREWLRGPLSKEVSYRLIVSGELGPREIGKLIKLLEAQKMVLMDDDEQD